MRRIALLGLMSALALPALADEQRVAPPNGGLLPRNVRSLNEDDLLGNVKRPRPALRAVGEAFHPEREPLILVHGLNGDFADLQPLVDRYADDARFQIYLLAYGDKARRTSVNGDGFAEELRALSQSLGKGRSVTILAHSMGGLVARRALNSLTASPRRGLEGFGRIRLVAIDSPWSGFAGPSDRGFSGFTMKIVAAFMPDGLEDMRAKSNLFRGDKKSDDPAARAGIFGVPLPRRVQTTLVFAKDGDQALDYTEKPVSPLASKLVALYAKGEAVEGDQRIENTWNALRQSRTFAAFERDVKACAAKGALDEARVRAALEEHFPRFAGDHSSVIAGEPFLAHLDRILGR